MRLVVASCPMTCGKCRSYRNSRDLDFFRTPKSGTVAVAKRFANPMLRSNPSSSDQLPVLEMGGTHDSIADASRTLAFQVVPVRHLLLEIAGRSFAIHFVVAEFQTTYPNCADVFPLALLEDLEYHSAVSRVPNQTLYRDGS